MDALWIILIFVLLLAGCAGSLIIRRYESREKPWQIKASEESERRIAAAKEYERRGAEAERKQPDIPVWRDRPKDN